MPLKYNGFQRPEVCAALACVVALALGGAAAAKPPEAKASAPAPARAAPPSAAGRAAGPGGVQQQSPRGFGGAPAAAAPRGFGGAPAGGAPRAFGGEAAHAGSAAGADRHFGEAAHAGFGGAEAHRAFGAEDHRAFGAGEDHRTFGGGEDHRAFGGTAGHFLYHGHEFAARHGDPYRWPHGYGYRRYEVGRRLPRAFWGREYYFYDYAAFGLDPPGPGYQWVRYGPDLLLISLATGAIVQTVYGAYD